MHVAILESLNEGKDERLHAALQRCGLTGVSIVENLAVNNLLDYAAYILPSSFAASHNVKTLVFSMLAEQNQLGKPILALGAACSELTSRGFIPGLERNLPAIETIVTQGEQSLTLTLSENFQRNVFTKKLLPCTTFSLTAPLQVDFIIPPGLLLEMTEQGQIIFRDQHQKIAAISNKAGNVMAMVADPQSIAEADSLFLSLQDYLIRGKVTHTQALYYQPR